MDEGGATPENAMPKRSNLLCRAAVIIASASLCLPAAALAQTDQPTAKTAATTTHVKKKGHAHTHTVRNARGESWAQGQGRCSWPYRNQFPPCQSTWPAGDPNFHGSTHPGITFDN
jgi:hypothetical protein